MVFLITFIQRSLNKLLPFATPGTPLLQDLLHLAALCTALYYAPQIQAYFQDRVRDAPQDQALAQPEPGVQEPLPEAHNEADTHQQNQPPQPFVQDASDSDASGSEDDDDDEAPRGFDFQDDNAGEGPVNPGPAAPRATSNRTVGAKKAKSLARRDQRRAYHEFMRSQGEAQRARDAAGAAEREAELAREKARRAVMEAELEKKRAKEREEKRLREEEARVTEVRRREGVVGRVREEVQRLGYCDLEGVAQTAGVKREWVEGLVRASGLLGEVQGSRTLITGMGWVVRVENRDMEELYNAALGDSAAGEDGVSYKTLGKKLESVLQGGKTAAR